MTRATVVRRVAAWSAALVLGGTAAGAEAAGQAQAAADRSQTIAIIGGTVHTVSGARIENGTVLIRDGRIAAVGANVAIPAGARRIEAQGRVVTPGLINGASALGLTEIGAEPATVDRGATGRRGIAAAFRAWEGFNPASVLLAPAREEGVTSVVLLPAGGLVAGQAAFIDLAETQGRDIVVRGPAAMLTRVGAGFGDIASRGELLMRLREFLDDTRSYQQRRADYDRGQSRELGASRLDMEAMRPVLARQLPLLVAVDQASDIHAALDLAREYNLRIMIIGGAEAWRLADRLASENVPVLTGVMDHSVPGGFARLGARQDNAALLRAAGVRLVIVGSAGEAFNVRNVRQEAGNAVAYGLPWEEALRAITLEAANVYGVGDRYGSLEAGKVANVVVWSGDPFEFASRAEHVFIRGQEMQDMSRQRMLMERYRTLPPSYRTP